MGGESVETVRDFLFGLYFGKCGSLMGEDDFRVIGMM